ncbi:MAG: nitroreductase family protein [Oscillospiraceae bacterium]|nr:nitroreductase family protein [Oscillospiraceae bacterium]
MEFFETVEKRYTHKERFLNEPVPREHLEAIAHAGLAAPSGCNAQSVSLIIIDDPSVLDKLRGIATSAGLDTVRAVIAVMTDPTTQTNDTNYEKEDYSAAVENMLLAATALGYASVWLDGILIDRKAQQEYLRVLGAPESFHLPTILPIGKPDGAGMRRIKRPYSERLSYNQFKF